MHSEKNLTILNIGNTHVHVFDSLPDGSIVSPSLEDMFPFLPEEEMKENVYEP